MNAQADKDEQNALKQAGDVILDVYDVKNQHIFQKRDVARDQPSFLFEDVRAHTPATKNRLDLIIFQVLYDSHKFCVNGLVSSLCKLVLFVV